MNHALMREAAAARAAGTRAPADRPTQRRSGSDQASPARVSVRVQQITLRDSAAGGGALDFEGFASVTGQAYEMYDCFGPYTEMVAPGAFAQSLARTDLDVPLVLQHEDLRRIARTTTGSLILTEVTDGDPTGLLVRAPALDPTDQDVAYIVPKLRSGLVDEMSFKFRITAGMWSPDWTEYHIESVDIHRGDVAIVGYGANPLTAGAGLRSGALADLLTDLSDSQAREALAALTARLAPAEPALRAVPVQITDADVARR